MPWQIGCEWHCFVFLPGRQISLHDEQEVSAISPSLCQPALHHFISTASELHWTSFLSGSLIWSDSMTNSLWVQSLFLPGSLITFCPMATSKWATLPYFLPDSLMISHPMMNSKWVMLDVFARDCSSYMILPKACKLCTPCFSVQQTHHLSFHDQQFVSDTTFLFCQAVSLHDKQQVSDASLGWSNSLSTYDPNSKWVTLNFFSFITHCTTNRLWVTLAFIVPVSHIIPHLMTDSKWVMLLYSSAMQLIRCHPMTNSKQVSPFLFLLGSPTRS